MNLTEFNKLNKYYLLHQTFLPEVEQFLTLFLPNERTLKVGGPCFHVCAFAEMNPALVM